MEDVCVVVCARGGGVISDVGMWPWRMCDGGCVIGDVIMEDTRMREQRLGMNHAAGGRADCD